MNILVVYESLWGNTAAVAKAIAAGFGPEASALTTAEATTELVADADLLVVGGPVFAFHLSSEKSRESIRTSTDRGMPPPDLSSPSIRTWLAKIPNGNGYFAAFDTHVRGPFGRGGPTIAKELGVMGYRLLVPPEGFVVSGKYGPLRPGELDRARKWGEALRSALAAQT